MSAPISRYNMESFSNSQLWVVFAALLAARGVCAGAGSRRAATGSILDIIDTEQVERLLAARRQQADQQLPYLHRNELGEGSSETMVVSMPDQEENTEIPPGVEFRKILKSSKNALVVTKKEYLKEDWCKTEPLVQKVREPGCLPTTVINKFCYGQCNSFYIPKGPRRRDGNDERPPPAFKSCSFCRPQKVHVDCGDAPMSGTESPVPVQATAEGETVQVFTSECELTVSRRDPVFRGGVANSLGRGKRSPGVAGEKVVNANANEFKLNCCLPNCFDLLAS